MLKRYRYVWAMISVSLFSPIALSANPAAPLSIGQYLPEEGGVVFYLEPPAPQGDTSKHTGLIVALDNACDACEWGSFGNQVNTSVELYSGPTNTQQMLAQPSGSEVASACSSYAHGGHTDWYVPSQKELRVLYADSTILNSALINAGGHAINDGYYWTSSQYASDNFNAWAGDFPRGSHTYLSKWDVFFKVRCVRTF